MKRWPSSLDEAMRLNDLHKKEQRRGRTWLARNAGWLIIAVVAVFIAVRVLVTL